MTKSGTQQIDLFTPEAPFVPEWLRSKTAFDSVLSEKWKCKGMRAAATAHQELLAEVKLALIRIALPGAFSRARSLNSWDIVRAKERAATKIGSESGV